METNLKLKIETSSEQEVKLDDLSKILLATGAIQYMSSDINRINIVSMSFPDEKGYHKDGIEERNELLKEVVNQLGEIMEKLGEYKNGSDLLVPIEERFLNPAFDIVCNGKDNVDEGIEEGS